jgi:hypothetical protein
MVTLERRPELDVRPGSEAKLRVDRKEILFHDLSGGRVGIQVTVHNEGERRSLPATMRIESAPLGAFVPWSLLARAFVPALEPGESHGVSFEVDRPRPAPLGSFDRVPPKRLITALSAPAQPPPPRVGLGAFLDLLQGKPSRRAPGTAPLAPDIWDWVGLGQPHWAGNINIFVGRHPVERHLAQALRIYPGCTNVAMFVVGSPGKREAFAFELVGAPPDWKVSLFDMTSSESLVVDPSSNEPIGDEQWVESQGMILAMLAIRSPPRCEAGTVEVHVTRRGSSKTAIVEFNLDPKAQGAGCYCL